MLQGVFELNHALVKLNQRRIFNDLTIKIEIMQASSKESDQIHNTFFNFYLPNSNKEMATKIPVLSKDCANLGISGYHLNLGSNH